MPKVLTIRIPNEAHKAVKDAATKQKLSANQFCASLLARATGLDISDSLTKFQGSPHCVLMVKNEYGIFSFAQPFMPEDVKSDWNSVFGALLRENYCYVSNDLLVKSQEMSGQPRLTPDPQVSQFEQLPPIRKGPEPVYQPLSQEELDALPTNHKEEDDDSKNRQD